MIMMETLSEINFPKILFIYDHDFLSFNTPIDPKAKYIEILRHIAQIKNSSRVKNHSIHWLASHPFPSVPFIEAASMLSAESLAKEIKYFKFVDVYADSLQTKRNQFLNLFGHLEREISKNKDVDNFIQIFVIDDLRELYSWCRINNFGISLFFNTLFQIINHPNFYLICISKPQITDWVDHNGDRKIRASFHNLLRIQSQASEIDIKFQWLVRPPSSAKLKSEYKKGTDTILSFFVSPQSIDDYHQEGQILTSILDYPEVRVCDLNLIMNENQTFSIEKKSEIIEKTMSLIQNYQVVAEKEREFKFSIIDDFSKYRLYSNSKLNFDSYEKKEEIRRRSNENDKLVNFIKHSIKLAAIQNQPAISHKENELDRNHTMDKIRSMIKEYDDLENDTNGNLTKDIDKLINHYFVFLGLDDDEILGIEDQCVSEEKWLKPFLALFIITSKLSYSSVKIDLKDSLRFALNHPQVNTWLSPYPKYNIYYNTWDAKKAVALSRKLPLTLNVLHPVLGLSYSKLDQILSKAQEGVLEVLAIPAGNDEYVITCKISVSNFEPIVMSTIGIGFYKISEELQPFLPHQFKTIIVESQFMRYQEDTINTKYKFKIINMEFSSFNKSNDLANKSWNKPTNLKLYMSELDVLIELNEKDQSSYIWKLKHLN